MECKYTKYSIIEIVPVELKSYKTPLITIINSVFLWLYLIFSYFYKIIHDLFENRENFKNLFKNKYKQNTNHLDHTEGGLEEEEVLIDSMVVENRYLHSENEIIKGKKAKKTLKELLENDNVKKIDLDFVNSKEFGSFVLRKEIITAELNEESCNKIKDKIILVRVISNTVRDYIDMVPKFLKQGGKI